MQTATGQSTITLIDVVTLTPETEAETATQQDVTCVSHSFGWIGKPRTDKA